MQKEWEPRWKEMEKDIEYLKSTIGNKVDYSVFDEEMEKLKALINSLAASKDGIKAPIVPTGPSLSTKELNDIREALKNIDQILKRLSKLEYESERLDKEKADKKDLDSLLRRMSELESQLRAMSSLSADGSISADALIKLTQRIEKLEQSLAEMKKSNNQNTISFQETKSSIGDDSMIKELNNKINQLRNDLEALRNEFARWLKEMQDSLNSKADLSALSDLEKLLMDRMNEIVKALTKQLADKNDTKKALKILEKQLKNLYELFMQRGGHTHDNEDDAMFTKKPLGGMSCASCEKDIINL